MSTYAEGIKNLQRQINCIKEAIKEISFIKLLDGYHHTDTTKSDVKRGGIIVGQGTDPKWDSLEIGETGRVLTSDGVDATWELNTSSGPQGPMGEDGEQGIQGNDGIQGIQGIQGNSGANGTDGGPGPMGQQGETGIQGSVGGQGVQGIQGETGNDGIQGIQGQEGEEGIQGGKGDDGTQGDKGNDGIQGIQGDKGDKGDDGIVDPDAWVDTTTDQTIDGEKTFYKTIVGSQFVSTSYNFAEFTRHNTPGAPDSTFEIDNSLNLNWNTPNTVQLVAEGPDNGTGRMEAGSAVYSTFPFSVKNGPNESFLDFRAPDTNTVDMATVLQLNLSCVSLMQAYVSGFRIWYANTSRFNITLPLRYTVGGVGVGKVLADSSGSGDIQLTSFTASMITDTTFESGGLPVVKEPPRKFVNLSSSSTSWNRNSGYNRSIYMTNNITLSVSNFRDGDYGCLMLQQDNIGNRKVTFPSGWDLDTGSGAASFDPTPFKVTIFRIIKQNNNYFVTLW